MADPGILKQLQFSGNCPVLPDHPLAGECTFKLGGPAAYYGAPADPPSLRSLVLAAKKLGLPWVLLGGGSNTLFKDGGYPGLVISTRGLNHLEVSKTRIKAGAGIPVFGLTDLATKNSLSGLEWAGGLPGSAGGGVFMNAKCYGGEFSRVVEAVRALDAEGNWLDLPADGCRFGYKDSIFQHQALVITGITFLLAPGDQAFIMEKTAANVQDRQRRGQFDFPSAGCVFKNPYELDTPAGALIEACGLKGRAFGGAKIFDKHANFIVNTGGATAADVLALISLVKDEVRKSRDFTLKEEIRILP